MNSHSQAPDWDAALTALARRVLGTVADQVTFNALSGSGRRFWYEAAHGHLLVRATDASSAAVGLHEYLRTHCGLAVSWDDPRPATPPQLPDAPATVSTARVDETYYLNFCTFGYTTAWWDWEQWEREIDWMALRGVTAPLMMVGYEAVMERALLDEGLDQATVDDFLAGPAYLPWLAMGSLDGFAGPPPTGWNVAHRDLADRILRRQRDLGMRPILPAFTGHVPAVMSGGSGARDWQGHRTHVIGPEDPLFRRMAASIVRVQTEYWGTDHRYASDPFIEMPPVENDPEYPGRVAKALLAGLTDADPEAVWFLQTWPFSYQTGFWTEARVRAFLDAIPQERLVLLDLWAEAQPQWRRFDGFPDRNWMWCALLNFGGRTDPIGDLPGLEPELNAALSSIHPPVGIGLSMEATRAAPVYFERVLDLVWQEPVPLPEWLQRWAAQRYRLPDGPLCDAAGHAWRGIASTVLASGDYLIFPESFTGLITQRPPAGPFMSAGQLTRDVAEMLWYDPAVLAEAWRSLVELAETSPERAAGPLGRDLIEVALAVLPRYAELSFLEAYDDSGVTDPQAAERFFTVFEDLDALLATRSEFRYDTWEEDALRWAVDTYDGQLLADNARRLLTVWGESGDGYLDDYAGRLWAGLIGHYRERWRLWAELHPLHSDHAGRLEQALQAQELSLLRDGPMMPVASGDVIAASRRLLDRYATAFVREVESFRSAIADAT